MFSCQLPDGRPQLFCARRGSLYTAWKAHEQPDAPWTDWQLFHQGSPQLYCTGVGAAAGYFASSTAAGVDGFPLVVYALDKAVPGLEKYSEVHLAVQGLPPDRNAWEHGICFRPPGNANTARISALAASTLSDGGVQIFFGVQYSSAFGGILGAPVISMWTDPPTQQSWARNLDPNDLELTANQSRMENAGDTIASTVLRPSSAPIYLAAAQLPNGAVQLFAAREGDIITTWKEGARNDASWLPWRKYTQTSQVAALRTVRMANGGIVLLILTDSSVLWSYKLDSSVDATWSPLQSLAAVPAGTQPHLAACQLSDNRVQFFVDTGAPEIQTMWQMPDGVWSRAQTLPAP